MVRMVDTDGDVVDVPDSLYSFMLERRYLPYLGSEPVPEGPYDGPAEGDVASEYAPPQACAACHL